MCHHSVLNLSLVERVKKCRFSNTNKNQNCAKIALGKNTILLRFRYSTLMFSSKRAPRVTSTITPKRVHMKCLMLSWRLEAVQFSYKIFCIIHL